MSLSPTTNPLRVSTQSALNGDFPRENLFIRSVETLTIGTGTLTQSFGVVQPGEFRPLIHSKIVVASGQFTSDATLTLQSANHVIGDLVTIEFVPSDFPGGRTLTVKDSGGTTLATATNASTSSPINFTLNSTNTWLVTDIVSDVLPQSLSTTDSPTFNSLNLQGAAGAGYVTLKSQSSPPAAPASNNIRIYSDASNKFAWIGSSSFTRSFDGTLTASRTYILPDASTSIPVFPQTITFTGPSAARTVTLPDAAFTVARTDAANTFTGHQTIEGVTSAGATGTNNLVFSTSPTFITPVLGAATATSVTLTNGGALNDPGTGALRLIASGTNQNVTLTPSGSGNVSLASGNLLLAGVTNGTGVLQLPATTTAAGGIAFGTNGVNIHQGSNQNIRIETGASNGRLDIFYDGSNQWNIAERTLYWYSAGTAGNFSIGNQDVGSLIFQTSAVSATPLAALTLDSSQNATFAKKIVSYNGISTVGQGVAAIYGSALSTTQTSNATVLTYTPPATAGRYRVDGVITTTSSTNTGTVQFTVDYVDSQGTTHTADIIPLQDAAGVIATTKSGASKEYSMVSRTITINNAASNIVVKAVITGSVSYTAASTVEQVA